MYTMYSATRGFRIEIISINETELGGIKGITFTVIGDGAYSRFKFESGVHRVQRIPVTESNGRIQTSTVTVAVLPEVDEVEVDINPFEDYNGNDNQLNKAVEYLLKEIEKYPSLPGVPAAPVRVRKK